VLNADALVTVVCPSSGLNPEVRHRVDHGQVAHIDRLFEPADLESLPRPRAPSTTTTSESDEKEDGDATAAGPPDMVLVAIDDPAASTQIWKLCKQHRIPANIADVPPECDFYFGSVHRDGPLQVMVSTNGKGPRLAASIRRFIAGALPAGVGNAIERVGLLRTRLRERAPEPADGPKRMRWMSDVSDKYRWDDLAAFTDEDLDNLLRFYQSGKVPELSMLTGMRGGRLPEDVDIFDGSYGFSLGV
jgi:precorrin-2 dehydrogenase / sirohydrochlorin ferrochelatase